MSKLSLYVETSIEDIINAINELDNSGNTEELEGLVKFLSDEIDNSSDGEEILGRIVKYIFTMHGLSFSFSKDEKDCVTDFLSYIVTDLQASGFSKRRIQDMFDKALESCEDDEEENLEEDLRELGASKELIKRVQKEVNRLKEKR